MLFFWVWKNLSVPSPNSVFVYEKWNFTDFIFLNEISHWVKWTVVIALWLFFFFWEFSNSFFYCPAYNGFILSVILFLHVTCLSLIPSLFAPYHSTLVLCILFFFNASWAGRLFFFFCLWPEVCVIGRIFAQMEGIFQPLTMSPGKHSW